MATNNWAVFIVDLDVFRKIHDAYGMTVRNELLKSAGNRINECVREKDMISHIPFQKIITYLKYESFFNP